MKHLHRTSLGLSQPIPKSEKIALQCFEIQVDDNSEIQVSHLFCNIIECSICPQTSFGRNVGSTTRTFMLTFAQTRLDAIATESMKAIRGDVSVFHIFQTNWAL